MPMYENNHGRTTAMWTGTTIVTIAFLIGTIGVVLGQSAIFWFGVILVPVGALVGKGMAMAGMGQAPKSSAEESSAA